MLLYSTPPLSHKNGNAFQPQIANKKNGSECRRSTRTRTKDEKSTGCRWKDGWLVAGGKEDTNTLFTISIHKSFLNTWQRQVDFLFLFFYGVFSSICFKTITFIRIIFFYYFFIILKSKCDKHCFMRLIQTAFIYKRTNFIFFMDFLRFFYCYLVTTFVANICFLILSLLLLRLRLLFLSFRFRKL